LLCSDILPSRFSSLGAMFARTTVLTLVAGSSLLGDALRAETSKASDDLDPDAPVRIPRARFRERGMSYLLPDSAEVVLRRHRWSPGGWVHQRGGGRAYFDLHIPKTAGCSFSIDIKQVLAHGEGYHSNERCYHDRPPMQPRDVQVAFLRNPTLHVYSQFLECKYDGWGKSVVPAGQKWIMQGVKLWLRHFDGGRTADDLRCYHPYNMQTRALSCWSGGCHHHRREPSLSDAMRSLDSLFFVGLVEHYQASICLFFAKTHQGEPLPRFCDCRDKTAWGSFRSAHESHGVPPHSLSDLDEEDLGMISNLTQLDVQLHTAATKRFEREAAEVKRKTGVQILC